MPSQLHEVLVAMVRDSEDMARALAEWATGERFSPRLTLRTRDQSYSEVQPAEYRADLVIEFSLDGAERPKFLMIFEVQLRRDPGKRLSWPAYQAVLRAQFGCPAMVVVLAPDRPIAQWCAQPIDLDGYGGSIMRPLVIGPDQVPEVTDIDVAILNPGIAALSAIAHGQGKHALDIGRAGLAAADALDGDSAKLYADVVLHHLDEAARAALEREMALKLDNEYQFQSSTLRKLQERSRAEGKAAGLLAVLQARGLEVDDAQREQIATADSEALDALLVRAASAESLRDVFDSA
ncbi:MAG: hypothetical protein AAGA54_19485 [Myxococcota bacterium]